MKRKFEFKLARLLRVRTLQEEIARAEMAAALSLALEVEKQRDQLSKRLRLDREALAQELRGSCMGEQVLARHATLDAQVEGLCAAAERARLARARAEAVSATWRSREQERRSLVELSQRGLARHRIELERAGEAARDAAFQGRLASDSQGDSSAEWSRADGNETELSPSSTAALPNSPSRGSRIPSGHPTPQSPR